MKRSVSVLLIEDNPGDARLVQEVLAGVREHDFVLTRVDRIATALERLERGGIDAVLLDLNLPDSNGVDTIRQAHDKAPGVPVIVLSGSDDQEMASKAVLAGAQDYLAKGRVSESSLVRSISYAMQRQQLLVELERTAQALEEKNRELEAFTYSVSHDLKEPLRTLEAFSQFVIEDYSRVLDEQGLDYLNRMSKASARLKQMIEELLILSQLGRSPEEVIRVDVGLVIDDIIAAMETTIEERRARIEVAPALPSVLGDVSRLEQIFGNLIGNALKFSQGDSPMVRIGCRGMEGGMATFFVEDNGIGIEPEYSDRIFGVFQRLHRREDYEGTGAGLAIVKGATAALGGRVWVESAPGAGATFFVALPVVEMTMEERAA